ncbi:hypothetical protein R6Q59_010044 [Mikania micrantha]
MHKQSPRGTLTTQSREWEGLEDTILDCNVPSEGRNSHQILLNINLIATNKTVCWLRPEEKGQVVRSINEVSEYGYRDTLQTTATPDKKMSGGKGTCKHLEVCSGLYAGATSVKASLYVLLLKWHLWRPQQEDNTIGFLNSHLRTYNRS